MIYNKTSELKKAVRAVDALAAFHFLVLPRSFQLQAVAARLLRSDTLEGISEKSLRAKAIQLLRGTRAGT